jgi:hypothetical protein
MRPELHRSAGSPMMQGHRAHCGCRKKIEGILPVLTMSFGDRGDAGVELAVVDNGGSGSHSTMKRRGNGEMEPELGVDAGCKDGALGRLL